jgi:murein DD-endopeptidase MepM/ murein hydrolase activator NlpD
LIADLTLTLDTVVWGAPAHLDQTQASAASLPSDSSPAAPIHLIDSTRSPDEPRAPARRVAARPFWSASDAANRMAPKGALTYQVQPGDTLQAVALRFSVSSADLSSWNGLEANELSLLAPGATLKVASPSQLSGPQAWLLPDSEVVYSPGAKDLDVVGLVASYGGYLNEYRERVEGEWLPGPEVVLRAAQDHSINPRLLLAILEERGGWLTNPERPRGLVLTYPIWSRDPRLQGLYLQLSWAANELSHAYYGWRDGSYHEVQLARGAVLPLPPDLNAASVAVLHLGARFSPGSAPGPEAAARELMQTYSRLFGDPWLHEVPLFEAGLNQPHLALPFPAENPWVFTGGPHGAWGTESAWAALDFAPKWDRQRRTSKKEIVALADAVVARVALGVVVLDLDGDGYEQTGWSVLYLHIVPVEGITVGSVLAEGDPIGVAAEEGGVSHGLHLHVARKYNGEWVAADGPLPIDLDGWRVRAGAESYLGVLYRGGSELLACPYASQTLLSVGGGEMLSSPGLPDNLRGCWNSPGSVEADPVPPGPPDRSTDPNTGSSSAEAFEPDPADLPPTRFRSASY